MLKKNGALLSILAGGVLFALAATAEEVEVIRAEDEDLLRGIMIEGEQTEEPTANERLSGRVYYPEYPEEERASVEEERKEWFNPDLLPTNQKKAEAEKGDLGKKGFREAINACMDDLKERLYMERGMFDNGMKQSVVYLSQTMAEINQCYEDVGYTIIEEYYAGDKATAAAFEKRINDFYVDGTDVNFNPDFCDDNCSMSDVLDAQMQKFAEFRIYLYQLLDNGTGGK